MTKRKIHTAIRSIERQLAEGRKRTRFLTAVMKLCRDNGIVPSKTYSLCYWQRDDLYKKHTKLRRHLRKLKTQVES